MVDYSKSVEKLYTISVPKEFTCELQSFYSKEGFPTVVKWAGTDTEDNFNRHIIKNSHRETTDYYLQNPIEYKINSTGFRDIELHQLPRYIDVYLGCSHTFGIGLHKKHIWATKLAEYLEYPSLNAGIAGSGVMTHFRLLHYLTKKFTIRKVFHYLPLTHVRYEWYSDGKYLTTNMWKPYISHHSRNSPLWLDQNIYGVAFVYNHAIKNLCAENNIEYYPFSDEHFDFFLCENNIFPEKNIQARDFQHPSVERNHLIFEFCKKKFMD